MVRRKVFALLVPGVNDSFMSLKAALKKQLVEVSSAETCAGLARLLEQTEPELIFTGTELSDGSWRDIVRLAEQASIPTNVIVVGKCKDTRQYLSAIEGGAFDFILPPFDSEPLTHVITVAVDNILSRRREHSMGVVA